MRDPRSERRTSARGYVSARIKWGTNQRLRAAAAAISVAILVIQLPVLLEVGTAPNLNGYGGIDHELYMNVTRSWMAGGPFYEGHQLSGPYVIHHGDVLYPPVALLLFVPFTFLPATLWWAIPIVTTLAVLVRLRPSVVVWPLMAACAAWQPAHIHIISGNPIIWSMAAVALGTIYKWPSVFALIKPSLFVFAFVGVRDRRWWLSLGLFAFLSALFLPMWRDWLLAIANSRGGGLFYSWQEAPLLLLPLIGWLGRPRGRYGVGERRTVRQLPAEVQVAQ